MACTARTRARCGVRRRLSTRGAAPAVNHRHPKHACPRLGRVLRDRQVPEAVCLPSMTYHEAWELSYFGANVLHPRTTVPALKYSIPISIRNFFNQAAPGAGGGAAHRRSTLHAGARVQARWAGSCHWLATDARVHARLLQARA